MCIPHYSLCIQSKWFQFPDHSLIQVTDLTAAPTFIWYVHAWSGAPGLQILAPWNIFKLEDRKFFGHFYKCYTYAYFRIERGCWVLLDTHCWSMCQIWVNLTILLHSMRNWFHFEKRGPNLGLTTCSDVNPNTRMKKLKTKALQIMTT